MKKENNKPSFEEEIRTLKMQIGGLKTSNTNYKKQVDELKEKVEHYKKLDKEGDELNEKRIAEIEEKSKVIDGLQSQIVELKNRLSSTESALEEARENAEVYKENYNYAKSLPWYMLLLRKW